MTNPNDKRIDDLIIENMDSAKNAVMTAFETKDVADLAGWERVLAAMRGLPEGAMEDMGIPLIQKSFMVFGCDASKPRGRAAMLPFQDIVALGLQDAMTLLMQSMQREQEAQKALRSGRLGK